MPNKKQELKEKGIWIVYNLEANRKIQELLMKEKFAFRFDPSIKIIEKKATELERKRVLDIVNKLSNSFDKCDFDIKTNRGKDMFIGDLKRQIKC